MKSEVTAAEQVQSTTTFSPSGGVTARAEPCPRPNDDESAAKYLFKLSHDVILSLDRVGNILCINQRGVQLSGYSETELRGANVFELLLFPEDRQIARAMLADVLAGEAREYEVRWKTKNGRIVHFDGATVPRLSDAGEFLSTLCTLRDVTERKCAEERLRKSEEKYRDLIEISPDAIYVVDADGVCVLGNRAGAELAGIPENKLVGTPVTDTYLPEERNVFRERLQQLKTGGTLRFERNFVRKNGDIVPVEVSVTAIRGGYFQAILRDISERKRSEALLAGEKRLLEMIATGVGLKEILNTLCLIIEEQRDGTLASVLLLNADGVHLDCIAG
ncbi:MAG TPA: PAS domain S-box protein, partial [Candidatus Udaeobacter sp.]|nr:PAS domain S-box protein [Candidatus Udaeobacter sp.]